MNLYAWLKTAHILSSVLLVGTGLGSAFYLFFANRARDVRAQALVSRLVVRADWWFTAPTVVLQPATGIAMAHLVGWPLSTPWIALSLALYALSIACWLPVVVIQMRMAKMAQQALDAQAALPEAYWRHARWWEALGYPAFVAMLAIFVLMVHKPPLWAG